MKQEKPKPYVTNKELMVELEKFNHTKEISEELGEMLIKIATRYTNRGDWQGYEHHTKQDWISEAVYRMMTQLHKFNVDRISYVKRLDEPYEDENTGKLIETETISVNLKKGNTMVIDGITYRRINRQLVDINDENNHIDLKEANPFAYLSTICLNKYIMEAKNYYKNINMKRELCEKYLEEIESNGHIDDGFLKKVLKDRIEELD